LFRTELRNWTKGASSPVSEADIAVNDLIETRLRRATPDYGWLSEESADDESRLDKQRVWIVDPIDGTINFVHGVRYWCVSIAFVVDGKRRIGVIYDPSLDELFWAVRGGGAFCGDAPIRASSCMRVDESLLCAGYVPRHSLDGYQQLERRLHEAGAAVKDMGAGALMLAHVAAGRFDAFIEPHMHPWDALAGLLLVEESGGRTYRYPGTAGLAAGGAVLAAAPGIFDHLLRLSRYPAF
jgi:myo-inositol-1(or 4)-monophosphatase